jgi:peptide/nickel transport system permease protein
MRAAAAAPSRIKSFLLLFSKKEGLASFLLGGALICIVVMPAALSLAWTPWPPDRLDIAHRLAPPSAAHLLGTDPFGRDLLSILMVGARNSIFVCSAAIGFGAAIGVPIGLFAAGGGVWRAALMRLADLGLAFPPLLIAAMIAAAAGAGMGPSIVAIGLFNVAPFMRITRGAAVAVLGRDYVAAARVAGRGPGAVLALHVLPNISAALLVQASVALAVAVLAEAGLSYLGLGTPAPAPSLGRALADYQTHVFDDPVLVIAPGVAIGLLVLGLNQLGDGLRDALDPKGRG